jgi:hypothetical protein
VWAADVRGHGEVGTAYSAMYHRSFLICSWLLYITIRHIQF